MNNPTDTNQASESELERKIEQCFIDNNMCDCGDEHTELGIDDTEFFDIEAVVKDIKQLIRTEKLKLLAAVRERVVGEGDFVDAEILKKLYDKAYAIGVPAQVLLQDDIDRQLKAQQEEV